MSGCYTYPFLNGLWESPNIPLTQQYREIPVAIHNAYQTSNHIVATARESGHRQQSDPHKACLEEATRSRTGRGYLTQ